MVMENKILVIDDNQKMCSMIQQFGQRKYNYKIDTAYDISSALSLLVKGEYKLITLDIELEFENGLEQIDRIKQVFIGPILFVSCISDTESIIKGFNRGADDYVTKPFNLDELFLRITRSIERADSYTYSSVENYTIDLMKNEVYLDHRLLELSEIANKILIELLTNKNQVLSREDIFTAVWEGNYSCRTRVIDTHISYIRRETNDVRIRSIRSRGYIFETDRE